MRLSEIAKAVSRPGSRPVQDERREGRVPEGHLKLTGGNQDQFATKMKNSKLTPTGFKQDLTIGHNKRRRHWAVRQR